MKTLFITIHIIGFCIQVASIVVNVYFYHKNTACYVRWHDRTFLRLRRINIGMIVWASFFMTWAIYWILKLTGVVA